MFERKQFGRDIATLEGNDTIRKGIALLVMYILTNKTYELGHLHHGPTDYEIVAFLFFNDVEMFANAVFQANGLCNGSSHLNLFANGINEGELHFWKKDRKGDARESAASADIEHLRFSTKTDDASNAQTVKYMVGIEIVNVFSTDDIDFLVPFAIERA